MIRSYLRSVDFERWFFTDDTPSWKRATLGFLLVATMIALLAVLALMFFGMG